MTWVERIVATQCPGCHAEAGDSCGTHWDNGEPASTFCASRIQAAEANAKPYPRVEVVSKKVRP